MKVAIVHDWMTNPGGGENVVEALTQIFPEAPIYTIVYDKKRMGNRFENSKIIPSFIQKMPFGVSHYTAYLPLMPLAIESFDLSEYDLVISSSTSCAKGVLTRADTIHICYCNTPMRYAWDFYFEYTRKKGILSRIAISYFMKSIRIWDLASAHRVDHFIANSYNVAKRIYKHYRRNAEVIHPPVDTQFYTPGGKQEEYYLMVGRLVAYKRMDLAIRVFNQLKETLVIVGEGKEKSNLKRLAGPNVQFLERLDKEKLRDCYRKCKAFIFPGEEDFGIAPLEAQACGRPVIAYGKGGALETVLPNETGIFFYAQTESDLLQAIKKSKEFSFNSDRIRQHAETFSQEIFKDKIRDFVNKHTNQ